MFWTPLPTLRGKNLQTTSWNMERIEVSYIVRYVGCIVKDK